MRFIGRAYTSSVRWYAYVNRSSDVGVRYRSVNVGVRVTA